MISDFYCIQILLVFRQHISTCCTGERIYVTVGMTWSDFEIMRRKFIPKICVVPLFCKIQIYFIPGKFICPIQLFGKCIPLNHPWFHDLQSIPINFSVESAGSIFSQKLCIRKCGFILQIFIQIEKSAHQLIIDIGAVDIQNRFLFLCAFSPAISKQNCLFFQSFVSCCEVEFCKGTQLLSERTGIISIPSAQAV